ncbi:MAG: glycosyltransferase [Actinobacteria bacterium]|nr:glycosyltransferase [Actinomycetota bacterium]
MDRAERRIRVLTMVDGLGTAGGGEGIARQIALHLDRDRFEVVFCVTRWGAKEAADVDGQVELREAGVALFPLSRDGRFDLAPWRSLVGRARRSEIDVVHTHKIGSNVWGALLSPLMGRPVFVAHEHTWSYDGNPTRVFLDRELIARRADAFVAVSREDQRRMIEIEGVPPAKTRFIANGIPPFPPATPGRDIRAELAIAADAPLVGVVATLRPQKALEVMVRAAAQVHEEVPEAVFLLIGGEAEVVGEADRLAALAGELGLGDSFRVLGQRDDVPDLVAALDIGALSSDFEGSPLSVMEYMEAGKPVVATNVGGLPDLVVEGVNGFLVERQDPAALAAALVALLRDPELARRMGEAGRTRRREEFSIEATARRCGELYEELMVAKGSTRQDRDRNAP